MRCRLGVSAYFIYYGITSFFYLQFLKPHKCNMLSQMHTILVKNKKKQNKRERAQNREHRTLAHWIKKYEEVSLCHYNIKST